MAEERLQQWRELATWLRWRGARITITCDGVSYVDAKAAGVKPTDEDGASVTVFKTKVIIKPRFKDSGIPTVIMTGKPGAALERVIDDAMTTYDRLIRARDQACPTPTPDTVPSTR